MRPSENEPLVEHMDRLTRRQFLRSAVGLGLSAAGLGLLAGCSDPRAASVAREPQLETTTLRLQRAPGLCIAPTYVAEDLLKAEGFTDLQWVQLTSNLVAPRVAAGELDLGLQFSGPLLTRLEANEPLVTIGGVHVGCFELFGTEQIRTIRDLKGKTVAITDFGGPEHVFLASMLAYVGLDPSKDLNWVTYVTGEAKQLLAQEKIDAILAFPPDSHDLRAKQIGHVVVNSMSDRPWSQYFCCMVIANRDFLRQNPVATKRALRAILKAADICAAEPERAARFMVDRGFTPNYDYALATMKTIPYNRWREYDPDDTLRFYALRLREAGMIKTTPEKLIAQGTDWRFFNELKKELKA